MPFIAEIGLLILLFIAAGAALVALISLVAFAITRVIGRSKKDKSSEKPPEE
jgi:tetrahydromethanopterin S-methyltransferase subunit E